MWGHGLDSAGSLVNVVIDEVTKRWRKLYSENADSCVFWTIIADAKLLAAAVG